MPTTTTRLSTRFNITLFVCQLVPFLGLLVLFRVAMYIERTLLLPCLYCLIELRLAPNKPKKLRKRTIPGFSTSCSNASFVLFFYYWVLFDYWVMFCALLQVLWQICISLFYRTMLSYLIIFTVAAATDDDDYDDLISINKFLLSALIAQ